MRRGFAHRRGCCWLSQEAKCNSQDASLSITWRHRLHGTCDCSSCGRLRRAALQPYCRFIGWHYPQETQGGRHLGRWRNRLHLHLLWSRGGILQDAEDNFLQKDLPKVMPSLELAEECAAGGVDGTRADRTSQHFAQHRTVPLVGTACYDIVSNTRTPSRDRSAEQACNRPHAI